MVRIDELHERWSPLWRYSLAVAIFLIALAIRLGLAPANPSYPFVTFYPAMVIAIYLCGIGPGVLVVALSVATAYFVLLTQNGALDINRSGIAAISTFLISVLMIGLIVRRLRNYLNQSRALFENSPTGIVAVDPLTSRIVKANPIALNMFGYSLEEFMTKTVSDITHPDDLVDSRQRNEQMASGLLDRIFVEKRYLRKDGSFFWAEVWISAMKDAHGKVSHFIGSTIDVTEKKLAQQAFKESELRYRALFNNTMEGIALCRMIYQEGMPADFVYLDTNPAFEKLTGLKDVIGKRVSEVIPGIQQSAPELFEIYGRVAKSGVPEKFEIFVKELGIWFSISVYQNEPDCFVATFENINERKASESRIDFLAYHDALTGLPNRVQVRDRFDLAKAYAERNHDCVALLYLDLDRFKTINDSLGHGTGDMLLKEVASRLRDCVRETDTISRQGGDEFVILLANIQDIDAIAPVSSKLLERVSAPFSINDSLLSISTSIGIAVYPNDGNDFDTLLRRADTAMYKAKESGRNASLFYNRQMNIDADERLAISNSLYQGLEKGEFLLYYQPMIDISNHGKLIGAEALLRWNRTGFGLVQPDKFIPIAEENGLIIPIGAWVLYEACRQAASWHAAGLTEMVVAVNLSTVQFRRGNLEQTVIDALTRSGLEPQFLELELTESILIDDPENVLLMIRRLKSLGIKLSIDDFGTGYSSLSYLKKFAVDKLKIDQSFVRGINDDPNDAAIVRAIIQLARSLNLKTIAEGVEDDHMLEHLRLYHCDEVQGFHIGKPMPAEEFAAFFSNYLR